MNTEKKKTHAVGCHTYIQFQFIFSFVNLTFTGL